MSTITGNIDNKSRNSAKNNGHKDWEDPDSQDPRKLIPELCNHFYHLGWASGTGGGLSIRENGRIYCAPSGVQKERIKPEDMFVLNEAGQVIEGPRNTNLKCSECLPLFMASFQLRDAGCCIHSHSLNANLVTSLYSKLNINCKGMLKNGMRAPREFRITDQEMIKGIKQGSSDLSLQYDDKLIVPIIDNVSNERDLVSSLMDAIVSYPMTNAVLVRNHGVYVWGKNWKQAKSMAECYDYLFKLKLEAYKYGLYWMLKE